MYLIVFLAFISFVLSIALTPLIRDGFVRIELVDRPDRFRKLHPVPIPRVGGLVIALSYVLAFAIALALPFSFGGTIDSALPRFWKVLPAAEMILVTGLIDDVIGLRPWQKLLGQLAACYIACSAGVRIELLGDFPLNSALATIVSVLWLLACTNAFNLIDGMDGLATGVGLFASTTVLIAALTHNSLDLALVTVPLIGSLLGFLRYNFNPASVFLGDSGSLLVGFILGCFGVLWSQKSATILGMTAPLMAVAIPLMDALLAITRRFLRNRPIFGADRGHIHHRLIDRGLTPRRAAVIMYAVSGLAAALSLLQNAFDNRYGGIIIILFCVGAWIGIQHLGYVEFGIARQMIAKGTFRRIVDAQTVLKQLESRLSATTHVDELWTIICDGVSQYGFTGIELSIQRQRFRHLPDAESPSWQVIIPLLANGQLTLHHPLSAEMDSVPVGALASTLRAAVNQHINRLNRETVVSSALTPMAT